MFFYILKKRTNLIIFLCWYRGLIFSNESKEEQVEFQFLKISLRAKKIRPNKRLTFLAVVWMCDVQDSTGKLAL